jgi:hypothetical protein
MVIEREGKKIFTTQKKSSYPQFFACAEAVRVVGSFERQLVIDAYDECVIQKGSHCSELSECVIVLPARELSVPSALLPVDEALDY